MHSCSVARYCCSVEGMHQNWWGNCSVVVVVVAGTYCSGTSFAVVDMRFVVVVVAAAAVASVLLDNCSSAC